MKKILNIFILLLISFIISSCATSQPTESIETQTPPVPKESEPTLSEKQTVNTIIFRDDSNALLQTAIKNNKVDLISFTPCYKTFNGCCLSNGISSYYNGIYSEFFNVASPLDKDLYCELWLHYKSDEGNVLAFPVEYQQNRNMLKVNGVYFECIKDENRFWVPNFNYFHTGWPSETFDYVMDFAPSKFVRFKQQFCKSLGIPSKNSRSGKLFPLEITENQSLKTYGETPFDDIVIEYKDISTGIDNFIDYYYFDRLDYLRDRLVNVSFLIRDNETLFPVEDAMVTIIPLETTEVSKEVFERFSDFTLRAPNFDYGFYGFKNCSSEKFLDNISMQNKLFTYFSEYKTNPFSLITSELKTKTNKNGEFFWTTNELLAQDPDLYSQLILTPLFKKEIMNKLHYFTLEKDRKYLIKVVHPRYQYFEREFTISTDSQVIVELAQITMKMESVYGRGNKENLFVRELIR